MYKEKSFSLTYAELQFYRCNGYLVVENVFSGDECHALFSAYEKYSKPDWRGIMNMDRGFIAYTETVDGKEIEERIDVAKEDAETVRGAMRHPTIVTVLEAVQEGEVVGLQTMFLFKWAESPYAKQAWNPHQDNAYARAPYGMYITGNIALTDQDPENGGMYIYPGSHREPILPNIPVKSFHEKFGENPGHTVTVPRHYHKVDLYLRKGAVLFLHGNVIHGSYANTSPVRSRPMLLIPYLTKGAPFIPGKVAKRTEIPLR